MFRGSSLEAWNLCTVVNWVKFSRTKFSGRFSAGETLAKRYIDTSKLANYVLSILLSRALLAKLHRDTSYRMLDLYFCHEHYLLEYNFASLRKDVVFVKLSR